MAEEDGLDLVLVDDTGEIPVCKILDFQKYDYKRKKNEKKKEKENNHVNKEFRIKYNIADNDIKIKAKNIEKTLAKNIGVMVVIIFPGRASMFMEDKYKLITNKLVSEIQAISVCISQPRFEGCNVSFAIRLLNGKAP